jgi:hypothetical protein
MLDGEIEYREGNYEAARIKPQLDRALARADVEIKSSCFCRTRASPLLS